MSNRTSSITRLILAIFLLVGIISCGGTQSDGFFNNSGANQASDLPVFPAGQELFGRFQTLPVMLLTNEAESQGVLALRDRLEEEGLIVGELGEVVFWPASPGSGWTLSLGDQTLVLGADGLFQVTVPPDGNQVALLSHPTDATFSNIELPLGLLSTDPSDPATVDLPMVFDGGCGMGGADDFCSDGVVARYVPPEFDAEQSDGNFFWGVQRTDKPRGTYPPPHEHIDRVKGLTCPQFDGYRPIDVPEPDSTFEVDKVAYLGSTCDLNVLDGACPNENPASDSEYREFSEHLSLPNPFDPGQAVGYIHRIREQLTPGSPAMLTPLDQIGGDDTSCLINHKGRMCGMFEIGDVSVDIGEIIKGGETGDISVTPGQTGSFVLHNNGVFGFTDVRVEEGGDIVTLTPKAVEAESLGGVFRIPHFDDIDFPPNLNKPPKIYHIYQPDRTIDFSVSENAQTGDRAVFSFTVDDQSVQLTFEVKEVSISPPSAELAFDETQTFRAIVIDEEVREGAIYRWSLEGDKGSLQQESETSRFVLFTPDPDAIGEETLILEVVSNASGSEAKIGEARAEIDLLGKPIEITPNIVSLRPGENQEFQVEPSLGEGFQYSWSLAGNTGTLSSTSSNTSTIYTVNSSIPTPSADTLQVVVSRTNEQGQLEEVGRAQAEINISGGSVEISPITRTLCSKLEDGESQGVTSTIQGDTGGLDLVYSWESLNGHGTITNGDQPTIIYKVKPGLTGRLTDRLKVTVSLDDPQNGLIPFATDTIDVPIIECERCFFVNGVVFSGPQIVAGSPSGTYIDFRFVFAEQPDALRYRTEILEFSFNGQDIPQFIGSERVFQANQPNDENQYRRTTAWANVSDEYAPEIIARYGGYSGLMKVTVELDPER